MGRDELKQVDGASDKSDRAGGPADLSRDASQPKALIPSAFEREDRYIVIKRKYLRQDQEEMLLSWLRTQGVAQVPKAVVVEGDWPEYETVWQMIEDRCAPKHIGGSGTGSAL